MLLLSVCAYWTLTIFGFMATDVLDFDLDFDVDIDAEPSVLQFGFIPLRFLRLKIRNGKGSLAKGEVVEIVDVREDDNVYLVVPGNV